ncbi:hypothetical protein CF326_g5882, partial [Tilletia indica]
MSSIASAAAAAATSSWAPRERSVFFQRKAIIITSVFLAIFIVLIIGCAVFLRDRKYDISDEDLQAEEEEEIRWEEMRVPEHERERMRDEREEMWIRREMGRKDAAKAIKMEKREAKAEAKRRKKALKLGIPYEEHIQAAAEEEIAGGSTALQTRFIAGRWARNRLQTAIRVVRPTRSTSSTSSSSNSRSKKINSVESSDPGPPTTTNTTTSLGSTDESTTRRRPNSEEPASLSSSLTSSSLVSTASTAAPAVASIPISIEPGRPPSFFGEDDDGPHPPTAAPIPTTIGTGRPPSFFGEDDDGQQLQPGPMVGAAASSTSSGPFTVPSPSEQRAELESAGDEEAFLPAYIAPAPSTSIAAGGPSRRADEKRRVVDDDEDGEEEERRRAADIEERLYAAGLGGDDGSSAFEGGMGSSEMVLPPPPMALHAAAAASFDPHSSGSGSSSSHLRADGAGSMRHTVHVATDDKAALRALEEARDAPASSSAFTSSPPQRRRRRQLSPTAGTTGHGHANTEEEEDNDGDEEQMPSAPTLALDAEGFEAFFVSVDPSAPPPGGKDESSSILPAPPRPHVAGWSEFDEPYRAVAGAGAVVPPIPLGAAGVVGIPSAPSPLPPPPSASTSTKSAAAEAKAREAGYGRISATEAEVEAEVAAILPSRPGQGPVASHVASAQAVEGGGGGGGGTLPQYEASRAGSGEEEVDVLPSAPPMWEE